MQKFNERYQKLNEAQRSAVDQIEGPVLVIAGPGTGKTELLTTRVANILLKSDARPENILCLTFTESAAYEMRQRLINIIGQKAYNVTISTYHAFGKELISRFPEYFTESVNTTPIDELGQYRIISAISENLEISNQLKYTDCKDILGTISELKRSLITPSNLKKTASENLKFIAKYSEITKSVLGKVKRIDKSSISLFEELLLKSKKSYGTLQALYYQELESAFQDAITSNKTSSLTAWKNKWLAKDSHDEFVINGESMNRKLLALSDVYRDYIDELNKNNLFDYDDMILKAISGLEKHKELKYTLQEQYLYILLDEFQDTNEAQFKLVNLLSDSPLYEQKPNVLAVGDDDQAIYAFQGANHSHMLTFINQYRDVRVISLTRNYRSHSDILHVAHNISGQIEQRLHHNISNVDKLIKAENSELPENATIERHEFKSDVAQFGWVAKKIAELISKGVSPEQIAILAPRHRYLEPVIPYLGNLNVPVRYEKRENILEDNHIIKIVNMTKLIWALGNNDNDLANSLWPEILSYDFWKVPTEAIWKLSWDSYRSKDPWTKLIIDSSWGNKIGLFFVRMGNLSKHETLETMLDYLIGVNKIAIDRSWYLSPFYDYYFSKDQQNNNVVGFWSLLSNLTVLRQHMRDYAQSNDEQPLKIDGFLNFIESHKIANIKILNTSPYHESVSAVQVMTAYKAKGLEFEYVFVLACTDEVWGSRSKSKYSSIGLPPNISHIRYGGANDDERLRLLFVAITRAKHGLFLSSYIKNFADRPTTRLKYFNEVEIEDKIVSTILPKKYQNIISVDSSAPELDDFRLYWQKKHTNIEGITTLKNLLRTRLDRYQMSPTHLNAFIDTVYGGPESFFINTILRFPKAPTNKAIFGTVIHNVLEWIHIEQVKTHKLPSPKMIHKYYRDQLISQTLNKTNYQLLLEHGLTVIDRYIDKKASDFSQNDVHEYNFKNQGVIVGEAHLTGKIDKMIIDKKKRKITIVDYKTGDSYDKWSSTNIKLHKYKQQLYMYKLLVEGSYQFADYSVDSALLEFVEPDNEGNIVQLEIKYNNEELIRLKKLINVVWVHIHELRFPDISNYSHDIYGIKKFEEDLLNNKV